MKKIKNKEMLLLTIFMVLAAAIVISYKLTENLPELFTYADFLYNLASQLALAYMGSYVFYFVQVYLPERRKQKIVFKCVKMPLTKIIGDIEGVMTHLKNKTIGEDKSLRNLSKKDFEDICLKIDPNDIAPLVFSNGVTATYILYLYNNVDKVKNYCNQLIAYVPLIDTEILGITDSIINSNYGIMVGMLGTAKIRSTDIGFLAEPMYNYYSDCCRLREYAVSNGYLIKD